jgi:hypothetical protein
MYAGFRMKMQEKYSRKCGKTGMCVTQNILWNVFTHISFQIIFKVNKSTNCTPMQYTYFLNIFFSTILHISMTVTLIYGRYESAIASTATEATHISHYTDRNWFPLHFTTHTPVSHWSLLKIKVVDFRASYTLCHMFLGRKNLSLIWLSHTVGLYWSNFIFLGVTAPIWALAYFHETLCFISVF